QFRVRLFRRFGDGATLRHVRVICGTAPRRTFLSLKSTTPSATTADCVAQIKDRTIAEEDRERVWKTVGDRTRCINELRLKDAARSFQSLRARNRNARREVEVHGKARGVGRGYEQPSSPDKLLQVL